MGNIDSQMASTTHVWIKMAGPWIPFFRRGSATTTFSTAC